MRVPVVDSDQQPLMPCSAKRARKLIARRDATPFWRHGIFCIRLNREPSARNLQPIAVGVDPGSKREGYAVVSEAHDLLFIDADARSWVGKKLEKRRILRRARRQRKTPCRAPAHGNNTTAGRVPAGTRARWEEKLRIVRFVAGLYPISTVAVENVKAKTRARARGWNKSFSPLEMGKQWLYGQLQMDFELELVAGYKTAARRARLGIHKSGNKTAERWNAHCVDAWVLARETAGAERQHPQHEDLYRFTPIERQRRCLHRSNPRPGGDRPPYGGTNKGDCKTGTLVTHPRYGLCYTGGAAGGRISLHNLETGKRRCQHARVADCRPRSPLAWRFRFLPVLKDGVSTEQTGWGPEMRTID